MTELRHQVKSLPQGGDALTALVDLSVVEIAKWCSGLEVRHQFRVDSHESAARGVSRDRIVGEDDTAEMPRRSVQWSVAFHGVNAVRDHEMDRDRRSEFHNGIADTLPMKDVLGPSVDEPGTTPNRFFRLRVTPAQ